MIKSSLIAAIMTGLALIVGTPAVAISQEMINVKPWFHCDKGRNAYMVPNTIVEGALLDGFTCSILDLDKESSKIQACKLKLLIPGNNWMIYNAGSGLYTVLDCSKYGSGIGSGSGSIASGVPTLSYGTWSWTAVCATGIYEGFLSFNEPKAAGDSFSGTFSNNAGGGVMSHGSLAGNSISFIRKVAGRVQKWIGTLSPDGMSVTGGGITQPPHETCTFTLAKK